MSSETNLTYPPINTLKPVTENLWIVDGPVIRFGMPWPKMPFSTRMTIIRLGGDDLFIHSPTAMIAWNPERIIIAHGRWYAKDGARELRRAFRWLLD